MRRMAEEEGREYLIRQVGQGLQIRLPETPLPAPDALHEPYGELAVEGEEVPRVLDRFPLVPHGQREVYHHLLHAVVEAEIPAGGEQFVSFPVFLHAVERGCA